MSLEATWDKIVNESEYVGFELLGYDFMIDQNLKVWLIEVNQNPCLSTLSPKQGELVNKLLEDTLKYFRFLILRLTIDPLYGLNLSRNLADFDILGEQYRTDYQLVFQKFF